MITSVQFTKNKPGFRYLPLEIDRGDCCCCQDPIKITYEILETKTNRGNFDTSMGAPGISFHGGPSSPGPDPDFTSMVPLPAWILENETEGDVVIRYDPLELMPDVPEDIFLYVVVRLESACNERFHPVLQEIEFCISIIDTGYKPTENIFDESDDEFERSYFVNKLSLKENSPDPVYLACESIEEQGWDYQIGAYHGKLCRDSAYKVNIIDSIIYDEYILNEGDGVDLLSTLEGSSEPDNKTPIVVAVVKDNKRLFDGDPALEGWTFEEIRNSFTFVYNPEAMNINIAEDDDIPDYTSQTDLKIRFIGDRELPPGVFIHFDIILACDCGMNADSVDGEDKTIFRRLPRPIVIETQPCPGEDDDTADDDINDDGVEGGGSFDNDPSKVRVRLYKYKINPRCDVPTQVTVKLRDGEELPQGFSVAPNIASVDGITYNVKPNPSQETKFMIVRPTSDPTSTYVDLDADEIAFFLIYDGTGKAGTTFNFNIVSSFTCDDIDLGDEQNNGPVEGEVTGDEEDDCPVETQVRITSITARNDINLINPNSNSDTSPGCNPCEDDIN